ncbi:Signal peptidase complex subunit 1 [Chamberlinius hualienensis]
MFESLKSIPTHMDYEGQRLAEKLFQIIIITSGIIGFMIGNYNQRFSYTVYILAAGFVLCCLLTLPPWSFYRKHPLNWQKPVVFAEEINPGDNNQHQQQQKSKQKKK